MPLIELARPEPDSGLISVLEELLLQAKAGDLRDCVIVSIMGTDPIVVVGPQSSPGAHILISGLLRAINIIHDKIW